MCIQDCLSLCMIGRPEAWMEINLVSYRGVTEAADGAEEDQEGGIRQMDHSKFSSSMEKLLVVLCLFSVQPSASLDWVCLPVCTVIEPFFHGSHINPKLHQWGTHTACLAGCALSGDTMNFQWKKGFREMALWACAVARVPGKLCQFA